MPGIVVTRLRLRDPALLDEFFSDARRGRRQRLCEASSAGRTLTSRLKKVSRLTSLIRRWPMYGTMWFLTA